MKRREFTKAALLGSLAVMIGLPKFSKTKRFEFIDQDNCDVIMFDEFTGEYEVQPLNDDDWVFRYKDLTPSEHATDGIWSVHGVGLSTGNEWKSTTVAYQLEFPEEVMNKLKKVGKIRETGLTEREIIGQLNRL